MISLNPFRRSRGRLPATEGPGTVHLSPESVEIIGRELDALRDRVVADLGTADRDHILRVLRMQRRLEVTGRALLFAGFLPPAWIAGVRKQNRSPFHMSLI